MLSVWKGVCLMTMHAAQWWAYLEWHIHSCLWMIQTIARYIILLVCWYYLLCKWIITIICHISEQGAPSVPGWNSPSKCGSSKLLLFINLWVLFFPPLQFTGWFGTQPLWVISWAHLLIANLYMSGRFYDKNPSKRGFIFILSLCHIFSMSKLCFCFSA